MTTHELRAPQMRLTAVTKTYGSRIIIADANLSIRRGEIIVIVGRSGSGKTTLLNLIGGLDRPSDGEIRLGDGRLTDMTESELSLFRRRSLGFVFQFFNLIPTLTAEENVRLPLALNHVEPSMARERARSVLAELGLNGCELRFPDELSGGEQQRVAIARAIVHEPALVLADEPTGNLDLDTAQQVLQHLDRSCRRRGTTLIMATHSREVIGLADRVLTIRNGDLQETPD